MADKRDAIMVAIASAMENISVANGYNSALGSNVIEWRGKTVTAEGSSLVPTEESELPALHIRDINDRVIAVDMSGNEDHELTLEFEVAHEGSATGATMRGQINDVRKAIGVDPSWGGLAKDLPRELITDTLRFHGERTFFRTLVTKKLTFSTSKYAEE